MNTYVWPSDLSLPLDKLMRVRERRGPGAPSAVRNDRNQSPARRLF